MAFEDLQQLVELVGAGAISEDEAHRRAESDLSLLRGVDLGTLTSAVWRVTVRSSRTGASVASLVWTWAARYASPVEQRPVRSVFVRSAIEALGEEPDGRLYRRAVEIADAMMADAGPGRRAAAIFQAGRLRLESFASTAADVDYSRNQGNRRLLREWRHGVFDKDSVMPSPVSALCEARDLLREAAEALTGADRGGALAQLAFCEMSLAAAGGEVELGEVDGWCAEAARLLPVTGPAIATARLAWLLRLRNIPDLLAGRLPIEVSPIDELRAEIGTYSAVSVYVTITRTVLELGLRMGFAEVVGSVLEILDNYDGLEVERLFLTLSIMHCLPGDESTCAEYDRPASTPGMNLRDALDQSKVATALHAYLHSPPTDDQFSLIEEHASSWGGRVEQLAGVALAHQSAIAVGVAYQSGDRTTAVRCCVRAALGNAVAGFPLRAALQLRRLQYLLDRTPDAAALSFDAAIELAMLTDAALSFHQIEKGMRPFLDVAALRSTQQCWRAVLRYAEVANCGPDWFTLAMQMVKGRGTANALAAAGPVAPTATQYRLLRMIDDEVGTDESPDPDDVDLSDTPFGDSEALLGAYLHRAEMRPGRTRRQRLANLRRRYQEFDIDALIAPGAAPMRTTDYIQRLIPEDALLVSLFFGGVGRDAADGFYAALYTSDEMRVLGVFDPTEPDGQRMALSFVEGGTVEFSVFGWRVAQLRRDLMVDPLHRAATREAEQQLADLGAYFAPLIDLLAMYASANRRRLLVWPHQSTYFLPFGLLPVGGGLLADSYAVTIVPSIEALHPPTAAHAAPDVLVVGSADGGVPFGLPAEPALAAQVDAIAARLGTTPLTGAVAKPGLVLSQMESHRFIHIAAHGSQDVEAPLFACLYLADSPGNGTSHADGRLFARNILTCDLHAVAAVTLSACESALLRYDTADNIHGLVSAFLRAGARAVIGALWPVTPAVAETFFITFYGAVAEGVSVPDAYATAGLVTRREHPEYRDWAAFTMFGS